MLIVFKKATFIKNPILLIIIAISLPVYCVGRNNLKSDTIISSIIQTTDTITKRKPLNEIRFNGWERSDWLDNEYIRTLRKYLDNYNNGIVSNPALDPYREQIKGQFVVYDINPYLLGGWIYSNVDEKKEIVESYEFRSISIEEETTDMTKEDILQAIKEMEGLKLW